MTRNSKGFMDSGRERNPAAGWPKHSNKKLHKMPGAQCFISNLFPLSPIYLFVCWFLPYIARLQSVSARCRNLAEKFFEGAIFFFFFPNSIHHCFFDSHTAPLAINPGRSWTKLVRQSCRVGCKRFLLHISPCSLRWRSKRKGVTNAMSGVRTL